MTELNGRNSENNTEKLNNSGINGSKNTGLAEYAETSSRSHGELSNNAGSNVGSWDAPRTRRRGRKPGSAKKATGKETSKTTSESNEPGEVRRRKRETEVLVGEQIRRLRQDSGLSQEELGRSSHMSTSYISRLETNEVNPTVDALNRIVRVFGLTIDGLLGLDNNASNIVNNEELDPEIRVWLFKLKGRAVSSRTKRIIQTVIEEELKASDRNFA